MKLSMRTRYGIRAILELAENHGKGPLQLKAIAEDQGISAKYLEQVMAVLKSAGIVRSIRGPNGGYVLTRRPGRIRVSECFNCLEGPLVTTECVVDKNLCARTADCIARQLWKDVENAVADLLGSMTLQSLIERTRKERVADYHIQEGREYIWQI